MRMFFVIAVSGTPLRRIGRARAIDYLLQVSSRDHFFDNTRIHEDFPMLREYEEAPFKTFARIRLIREGGLWSAGGVTYRKWPVPLRALPEGASGATRLHPWQL